MEGEGECVRVRRDIGRGGVLGEGEYVRVGEGRREVWGIGRRGVC